MFINNKNLTTVVLNLLFPCPQTKPNMETIVFIKNKIIISGDLWLN